MSPDPIESEIKVMLTEEEHERISKHLGEPERTFVQINTFFDTVQGHLEKAGLFLRVREEFRAGSEPRYFVTVKGKSKRAGALMVRTEVEAELTKEVWFELSRGRMWFPDLDIAPVKKLQDLIPEFDLLEIRAMGGITNTREVFALTGLDGVAELVLELDGTKYPDGSVDYELEAEIAPALAGEGARVIRVLFNQLGIEWKPSESSKYGRFLNHMKDRLNFRCYESFDRENCHTSVKVLAEKLGSKSM